jgi:PKD repeat protein
MVVRFAVAVASIAGLLVAATPRGVPTALGAQAEVGYRDFSYAGVTGADNVSAASVQNKLWFHDGRWFGVLFDHGSATTSAGYRIFRFDMSTQTWINTGVAVDKRERAHPDVVAAGNKLYVASSRSTRAMHLFRYTYDPAAGKYVSDNGFPVSIGNTANGTGYVSLARGWNGNLWMVYPVMGASSNQATIHYSMSSANGASWTTGAPLPETTTIWDEDVAAVVPFGSGADAGVGVLWSDQNSDAFYFSAHLDSEAGAGTWLARESALAGAHVADNHISVKTAPSGEVLAAVKTDMNAGADPSIVVLHRADDATWDTHTVSTGSQDGTRPYLLLDAGANQAAVYLTAPAIVDPGEQRKLYRRTAPLDTLDFGSPSLGTVVIANGADPQLNDPSSTKDVVDGAGQLVIVSDVSTFRYLHSCVGDPCPVRPVADISATPTVGDAPIAVSFTDESTNHPTTWRWDFGDGTTSTAQNPTHTYTSAGTYAVSLTAGNAAGSDTVTKTDYIVLTGNFGPTIGALSQRFVVRQTIGSTTAVRLAWSATDPDGDGVSRYRLDYSTDGGTTWHKIRLASPLSTGGTFRTAVRQPYLIRVRAWDGLGAMTQRVTELTVRRAQERSSAITYDGTWKKRATSTASGGAVRYTTARGDRATYAFVGSSIGFVTRTAPSRGIVRIYVDGVTQPSWRIDLGSNADRPRRLVFSKAWSTVGSHEIRVVLVGAAGRHRLDVDAFQVGELDPN